MAEEAKVRVSLDTRDAVAALNDMRRKASAVSGRVGSTLRRTVGRGLGVIGLGGGVGAGLAAVRGATQSGLGDVIGEAFGGIGANIAQTLFGELDERAKASKAAREETIQAFGTIAGATGKIPPGAVNYFNQIRALREQEERGREIFERDDRFRSVGAQDLVDRVLAGIGQLLTQAVDYLWGKIWRFGR